MNGRIRGAEAVPHIAKCDMLLRLENREIFERCFMPYIIVIAFVFSLFVSGCNEGRLKDINNDSLSGEKAENILEEKSAPFDYFKSFSGNYLAGRVAQKNNDWQNAGMFFKMASDASDSSQLRERAMILAVGSGMYDEAIKLVQESIEEGYISSSTSLVMATYYIKQNNYEKALEELAGINLGNGADALLVPVISAWAKAGNGVLDIEKISRENMHLFHAVLICHRFGDHETIGKLLENRGIENVIPGNYLEEIGDMLFSYGYMDKAKEAYENALRYEQGEQSDLESKISFAENPDSEENSIISPPAPLTIQEGTARAFLELSQLLLEKHELDIAMVFAHLALYLVPESNISKILIAMINAEYGLYDQAIAQLKQINSGYEHYSASLRQIATLLSVSGKYDQAVNVLEPLIKQGDDLQAYILMTDIYISQKKYEKALQYSDLAIEKTNPEDTETKWSLLFSKGSVLERLGRWRDAEKVLEQALEIQPDEPYVLNYLGYTLADQGVKLDKAYELISKALEIMPSDAAIRDSMGWVLFRKGKYDEAISHLEQAVEALPHDPEINDHLGDAYWMIGRKREARFQWEKSLSFSGNDVQIKELKNKIKYGINRKATSYNTPSNNNYVNENSDEKPVYQYNN